MVRINGQLILVVITVLVLATGAVAGLRGPGHYSGVVVFDRWDGCTLYSGVFLMYVSETVKEQLRDHAGRPVTLDARDVFQPVNPGDGLIRRFELAGPKVDPPRGESPGPFELTATPVFQEGKPPAIAIRVENSGDEPATLNYGKLAPTLLAKKTEENHPLQASDGPSFALITRNTFWLIDEPRLRGQGARGGIGYRWQVTNVEMLPREVLLQPEERVEMVISFELPEGEYDFLVGYGGGVHEERSLASNLIAFDVAADGSARSVSVEGRGMNVTMDRTPPSAATGCHWWLVHQWREVAGAHWWASHQRQTGEAHGLPDGERSWGSSTCFITC